MSKSYFSRARDSQAACTGTTRPASGDSSQSGAVDSPFRLTRRVLESIVDSIAFRPPEFGGMLGGTIHDGVVTDFFFDRAASRTSVTYSPDVDSLNRLLAEDWNPRGIRLLGFVHSHPGLPFPSGGDRIYARRLLNHLTDLDRLLLPIVDVTSFMHSELHAYAATRATDGVEILPLAIEIVESTRIAVRGEPFDLSTLRHVADARSRNRANSEVQREEPSERAIGSDAGYSQVGVGASVSIAVVSVASPSTAEELLSTAEVELSSSAADKEATEHVGTEGDEAAVPQTDTEPGEYVSEPLRDAVCESAGLRVCLMGSSAVCAMTQNTTGHPTETLAPTVIEPPDAAAAAEHGA